MKNLLLLILLIPFVVNAQTFEKIINFNADIIRSDICEIENGYLLSFQLRDDYNVKVKSKILKLNYYGDLISIVDFNNYYTESILRITDNKDNTYSAFGFFSEDKDSLIKIIYYRLGKNLEIINKKTFNTTVYLSDIKDFGYIHTSIYCNNNIIFSLSINSSNGLTYFLEITKNGELIKYKNIQYREIFSISLNTNKKGGYYFFNDDGVFELDSNFEIIRYFAYSKINFVVDYIEGVSYDLSYTSNPIWENDSVLTMGFGYVGVSYRLGILKTLRLESAITDTVYNTVSNQELPGSYNFFDTSGNYYYLGSSTKFEWNPYEYLVPNEIRIRKVNKNDLSIKWDKVYDVDSTSNYAYNLIATKDGGCILVGKSDDLRDPAVRRDLYILKVDSLGNYKHPNSIITQKPDKTITVYPNPGSDYIDIKIPVKMNDNATFELYSISGRKILTSILKTENTTILLPDNLQQGIYFYRITSKNKVLSKGKWVKE